MTPAKNGRPTTLSAQEVLRTLRSALDRRFPGSGGIDPWVRLDRLHGYDNAVAAELLASAFAPHGLTFRVGDVVGQSTCLADLISLVDRTLATRLHQSYS